jgi:hypothetical protein
MALMAQEYAEVEVKEGRAIVETDQISAEVWSEGYVSGVKAGTFRDKRTGAVDLGFGLDIVDFLLEPGPHADEEKLPEGLRYSMGPKYHGKIAKHYVELPQVCTQARKLPMEVIEGKDFVAVKLHYSWTIATPGYQPGSRWEQTMVFPRGKRFFYSTDEVRSANDSAGLILRIDMPGHLKHKQGDSFEEIYLSYHGRIPAQEFLNDFAPDEKFIYQRPRHGVAKSVIHAYKIRGEGGPSTMLRGGPWLAGMTLDPAIVWEAWCHQRGYVCFIQEIGGYPMRHGQSFGAVYIVGYFDSIEEMNYVCEEHRGVRRLTLEPAGFRLERG